MDEATLVGIIVLIVNVPGKVSTIEPRFWKLLEKLPLGSDNWSVKALRCPQKPVAVKVTEIESPGQKLVPEMELIVTVCPCAIPVQKSNAQMIYAKKVSCIVFMGSDDNE